MSRTSQSDFETAFRDAKKLVMTLKGQLEDVETGRNRSPQAQSDVASNLSNATSAIEGLQKILARIPSQQVQMQSRRMEILRTEVKDLTYQFRKSCPEYHLQRESEERRQLLGDTPRSPLSASTTVLIEDISTSTERSIAHATEIEESGWNIITAMREQRETMKGIQRKLLDMASSIGFSRTLMRLIERRDRADRWLVYVGIAIFSAILILLWWYMG